jgi:hypothetical protein
LDQLDEASLEKQEKNPHVLQIRLHFRNMEIGRVPGSQQFTGVAEGGRGIVTLFGSPKAALADTFLGMANQISSEVMLANKTCRTYHVSLSNRIVKQRNTTRHP